MGRLPDPTSNGMDTIALRYVQNGEQAQVVTAVVVLTPRKVETDLASGDQVVKYGIDMIEPLDGNDASVATTLLGVAAEKRNNPGPSGVMDGLIGQIDDAMRGVEDPGDPQ
jgi:hypothetical protein